MQKNYYPLFIVFCLFFTPLGAMGAKKKVLVYCSEGSPSSFNPQIATDGPSLVAGANMIYNRLVAFKPGTTEIIPSLASSWKIAKDGKSYTFYLRKGIKFHSTKIFEPTRDFNATDVLFSFNRQRLKTHPFHKISGGNYDYFLGMEMNKIIKDIKKVDDYTVEFLLSKPVAPFLANMGMHFASILSEEYAMKMLKAGTPEKVDTLSVGTGAFIFQRYVKDSTIHYTANPSYFLGKSPLDKVVFAITKDPSVRYQKIRTGECHIVTHPSPADLISMEKNTDITVLSKPGLNVGYIAMNVEKKPFNNVIVRQAIYHALNRSAYIKAIYLGHAQVAKNPIPPTMWSYNEKIKDHGYDIKKAKQLLIKAGYPEGFSAELWTLPVSRPYNPSGKKMGEMIQSDLAKVGVKIKLISYDWPTYLKKSRDGEHQMIQLGWSGDNGDPDNFLHILLGCAAVKTGGNVARWCYKPFNDLVEQAQSNTNRKVRKNYYLKAQKIFKQQNPWVPIAHSIVYRAVRSNVKGFLINGVGDDSLYGVDIRQ